MSLIRLEAATQAAELALFDARAVPALNAPDDVALDALAAEGHLLRLPSGANGSYLLHLYTETAVPPEVLQYCDEADSLKGDFRCESGHIGFGGVESAFQAFAADPAVRTDAAISPGDYAYTAYHTEFPGKLLRAAVEAHLSASERRLLKAPMQCIVVAAIAGVALAWLVHPLWLVALLLVGYGLSRWIRARPAYVALGARCRQARINFPSIVVALRKHD
jgi:hypothetical protein